MKCKVRYLKDYEKIALRIIKQFMSDEEWEKEIEPLISKAMTEQEISECLDKAEAMYEEYKKTKTEQLYKDLEDAIPSDK